jgi:hypothetical protein
VVEGRERIIDGRVDAALERVYRRLTYTGAETLMRVSPRPAHCAPGA